MRGHYRSLLERLFEAVRAGCPAAWDEPRRAAVPPVGAVIDGEALRVVLRPDGPVALLGGAPAPVRIEVAGEVLREVLLGQRDLVDALLGGQLVVHGAAADLARLDRFVHLLVAGAARSPRAAGLAGELLRPPGVKAA